MFFVEQILAKFCPKFLDLYASLYGNDPLTFKSTFLDVWGIKLQPFGINFIDRSVYIFKNQKVYVF